MTTHDQDQVLILEPTGPLYEGADCDALEAVLMAAAANGQRMIVDLARAQHITARCLGVLAHAEEIAIRNGGRLMVCGADAQQQWLFARTELTRPLGVVATRAEALQELGVLAAGAP